MSRVQLALNVSDLDESVRFYTEFFGVEPHKLRPGYANFAIAEPPLKLVLIESAAEDRGHGVAGALNHLGVEVDSAQEVRASADRLAAVGLATVDETDTTCCYALQDKVWVHDPAGAPWEVYTVKDDNPVVADGTAAGVDAMNDGGCCTSAGDPSNAQSADQLTGACC